MIDTLKLSKGLQKAGMTADQAEGIAEALNEAQIAQILVIKVWHQILQSERSDDEPRYRPISDQSLSHYPGHAHSPQSRPDPIQSFGSGWNLYNFLYEEVRLDR